MAILRNIFILFLILGTLSFAIDITSCTNISYSGSYVLTQSLSGVNSSALPSAVPACIFINSSDVTFSCGEATRYNVSADSSISSSRGILVLNSSAGALSNVLITNCSDTDEVVGINGYDYGFETSYSQVTIQDSRILNTTYGAQVTSNDGNRVAFVNVTILNSTSLSSTTGIQVSDSSNVSIENSSFLNLRAPITFSSSNYSNFTRNFINNTLDPGLTGALALVLSNGILIDSNNFSYTNASTIPTIHVSSSDYNTVNNNTLLFDQSDPSALGILITSANNNNVTNNYIRSYSRGISLSNTVQNNTVSGNTIIDVHQGVRFGTAQISTISYNNISGNYSIIFVTSGASTASGLVNINSNNLSNGIAGVYLNELVYNTSQNYLINVSNNFANNLSYGYYARMTNASIYLTNNTANASTLAGYYYGRAYTNSTNNLAQNGLGDGYLVNSSSLPKNFTNNNATDNVLTGFSILSSPNTSIFGGTISGSTLDGIFLNQSGEGTIINQTTVHSNSLSGIHLFQLEGQVDLVLAHLYNNSLAFELNNSNSAIASKVNMNGVVFDSPSGSFVNYTNITLSDDLSSTDQYVFNWSVVPSATFPTNSGSFENKYLNITNYSQISIDSLSFNWLSSESSSFTESRFVLYKYNSSGWFRVTSTLSTSANTLSASSLSSFSVFAILENNTTSSEPSSGGSSSPSSQYSLGTSLSCTDGLALWVSDRNDRFVSSDFFIYDSSFNEINSGSSSGTYYFRDIFAYCSQKLNLRARFSSTLDKSYYFDCSSCAPTPECRVDSDCSAGYLCSLGSCIISPPTPECRVDSDCSSTSICSSGMCTSISCPSGRIVDRVCIPDNSTRSPECTSDASCASDSYCGRGSDGALVCLPIVQEGLCGEISNHQFVSFQCGSDPSCAACPTNYTCSNHRCVTYSLNAPERGVVGSQIDVFALLGENPASGSSIRVTSPDGTSTTLRTDLSGRIRQLFGVPGVYRFDLVQNGTIVKSVSVTSVPRRGSSLDDLLSVASAAAVVLFPWLLLLLIAFGVYYYYRRMRKN